MKSEPAGGIDRSTEGIRVIVDRITVDPGASEAKIGTVVTEHLHFSSSLELSEPWIICNRLLEGSSSDQLWNSSVGRIGGEQG
jgi:hypothetical protein